MQTNPIATLEPRHVRASCFDHTGHFVPEGEWERIDARFSGAIMNVRMTNAGSFHAHQNVIVSGLRLRNIVQLKRTSGLDETNRFHLTS